MLDKSGKYLYTIRSANGVLVKNLKIYGQSRQEADEKIKRMYLRCDIISCESIVSLRSVSSNYEDVLDSIIKSNS